MTPTCDAFLLVSFGGPEGPADVMPFLENVTRGRGVPCERLQAVAHHYLALDGVSPINAQNRALLAAIEAELATRGIELRVYCHIPRHYPKGMKAAVRVPGIGSPAASR